MLDSKNIKIFLNYWLGPLIFAWLSWSIYRQVKHQPDLPDAWKQIRMSLQGSNAWKLMAAMGLMLVNWGIEALKWRELLLPLHRISGMQSVKAILAGVAFAVNTPNRIGEYGGRVLYLPDGKRLQAVSLTLIGSYSQLLVTLWLGTTGLWMFYLGQMGLNLPEYWQSNLLWIRLLCIMLTIISLLLMFVYLRISWWIRLLEKVPGVEKWGKALLVIDHLPVRVLLRVFGWSLLRYGIFIIQYILLLQCFEVTNSTWVAGWMVSIQFLVLAIIPTIALAELGIRGKLALELFGWVSANQLGIITATVTIWLVNLILPAVAGSILIIRVKVFGAKADRKQNK